MIRVAHSHQRPGPAHRSVTQQTPNGPDLDPELSQELLGNAAVTEKILGEPPKPPGDLPEQSILAAIEQELSGEELDALEEEGLVEEDDESCVGHDVVGDSVDSLSSGGAMPHREEIQAAFGHHSVDDISVSVGGEAGRRAEQMGATGFAVGNAIGTTASPDLWTLAHEGAHVAQQRGGVALRGEGEENDAYERHADAVADAVVRGESVESMLDEVVGTGTHPVGSPVVQRSGGLPTPPFGDADLQGLSKEQLDELYKKYSKTNPNEARKVKRMQKSKGFRGSSVKKKSKHLSKKAGKKGGKKTAKRAGKKLAKKALGAVARKFPVLAVGFFAADWASGGFGHAVNELVWPLSELWN